MRLITVQTPKGKAEEVVELALRAGISEVTVSAVTRHHDKKGILEGERVDVQTNTKIARKFVYDLMNSDFYDPEEYSLNSRHPESLFSSEPPKTETIPYVRPSGEIYEELWQFSQVTLSLIVRVFLSSVLAAYGVRESYMPLIIAGLLFLPYHHHLLGVAIGAGLKEKQLLWQASKALLLSTILIFAGGIVIGLMTESGIKFTEFGESPIWISFIISVIIGIAAAFGTLDDAGRRELIGLAATAHLAIYPMWFGLKVVYGFDSSDKPLEFLFVFFMDIITISSTALLTYKMIRLKGSGIRKFAAKAGGKNR